ncbi:uncharacterized protein LY79DRAFT_36228 [Colletotrichum navitas]|uniref:Uncharacterized protein n=1 Tax=Colletotrichum navitas TaxID=681940 RepID=A0AAD8Q811_9PEZI|nr:uncharacterized protein LY79DRAFT_36228 [Colletotrichum navitas]KAK1596936.1 hypothetical protein LY79DRAFT_36228 [Colletotrichum navitas]
MSSASANSSGKLDKPNPRCEASGCQKACDPGSRPRCRKSPYCQEHLLECPTGCPHRRTLGFTMLASLIVSAGTTSPPRSAKLGSTVPYSQHVEPLGRTHGQLRRLVPQGYCRLPRLRTTVKSASASWGTLAIASPGFIPELIRRLMHCYQTSR